MFIQNFIIIVTIKTNSHEACSFYAWFITQIDSKTYQIGRVRNLYILVYLLTEISTVSLAFQSDGCEFEPCTCHVRSIQISIDKDCQLSNRKLVALGGNTASTTHKNLPLQTSQKEIYNENTELRGKLWTKSPW